MSNFNMNGGVVSTAPPTQLSSPAPMANANNVITLTTENV